MADGGLTVLDGSHLRSPDFSLPFADVNNVITGAQLLELAESKVSLSLFGLTLPENLKSSVLRRLGVDDDDSFRLTEFDREKAYSTLQSYVTAVADELKDDPIVVAILDGRTLKMFLEDEDDFAMLAENLFTELDTEDCGKITKSEIKSALLRMGVETGIPPLSEFPQIIDILRKHGAEGEEELGQAQFAHLLQPVLQELADALAEKPILVVQNIKLVTGSKIRRVLHDEKQLNSFSERIIQESSDGKDGQMATDIVREFLKKNGQEFGLPPFKEDDMVALIYSAAFSDVDSRKSSVAVDKEGMAILLKDVLEKFAEQLDADPIFQDLEIHDV